MQEKDKNSDILETPFEFWLPLDKANPTVVKDRDGNPTDRVFFGLASTERVDLDNEVVKATGIDFGYFREYGYFNNDHLPGWENKVGEPIEVYLGKGVDSTGKEVQGLWVKGLLYKGKKVSDEIWNHIEALEKSGSKRKVGLSIQGAVKSRAGKVVLKSWVQAIAITPSPKNVDSFIDVVKTISKSFHCKFSDSDECRNCDKECPYMLSKSLSANSSVVTESLDSPLHKVDIPEKEKCDECKDGKKGKCKDCKTVKKGLSVEDFSTLLQTEMELTKSTSDVISNLVFLFSEKS